MPLMMLDPTRMIGMSDSFLAEENASRTKSHLNQMIAASNKPNSPKGLKIWPGPRTPHQNARNASRLPSFSHGPESIGKDGQLGEHSGEACDQRQQPGLRHGRNEFVEHAALPEQRVGTVLGGV